MLTNQLFGLPAASLSPKHEAYAWGSNSSHQLVEGNKDKVLTPKKNDAFKDAIQVFNFKLFLCHLYLLFTIYICLFFYYSCILFTKDY